MHVCPHCQKLGISTYAAIIDPFARGLASCRYCSNVSKRRRNPLHQIVGPVMVLAYLALVYFMRPPTAFGVLYGVLFMFAGLWIVDQITVFDKHQPPGEKKSDLSTAIPREQ